MKAEDILPDRQDRIRLGGVEIRKGSVGAFIANARLLLEEELPAAQRRQAEEDLRACCRRSGHWGCWNSSNCATRDCGRWWRIGKTPLAAPESGTRALEVSVVDAAFDQALQGFALTDRRAHRHVREAAVAALDDVLGLEVQGAILELT